MYINQPVIVPTVKLTIQSLLVDVLFNARLAHAKLAELFCSSSLTLCIAYEALCTWRLECNARSEWQGRVEHTTAAQYLQVSRKSILIVFAAFLINRRGALTGVGKNATGVRQQSN